MEYPFDLAYQFQFFPTKILPTCWGRWGQVTPARYKAVGDTLRKPQPWASGTPLGTAWGQAHLEPVGDPSSAGPVARRGRAVGLEASPATASLGPAAAADTPRGWCGVPRWGQWGRHWSSSALETLTKFFCVGNFTLSLIISITIWRTYLFTLLSKCAALCLSCLFFCHRAAINEFLVWIRNQCNSGNTCDIKYFMFYILYSALPTSSMLHLMCVWWVDAVWLPNSLSAILSLSIFMKAGEKMRLKCSWVHIKT